MTGKNKPKFFFTLFVFTKSINCKALEKHQPLDSLSCSFALPLFEIDLLIANIIHNLNRKKHICPSPTFTTTN